MSAWLVITTVLSANAAPLRDAPGLGLRLSGETLQDGNIATGYGSGSLSAEGLIAIPLGPLEFGLSAGYRRLGGNLVDGTTPTDESSWISYAPLGLTLGARLPAGSMDLFARIGPGLVVWEEEVPTDPLAGIGSSGVKYALLVEGGVGIPLPVLRSLHDPDSGLSGLELQIDVGYRYTLPRMSGCLFEAPCGLSFSAFRAGVGLLVRL
jgi:hypothetical protein